MKPSPDLKAFLKMVPTAPEADCLRFLLTRPEMAEQPGALLQAALHGRAELVARLLEMGADPDASVPSHEHYRPLHRAIEHRGVPKNAGHVATVKLLLEAGADPDLRSTWMGLTALATAGMTGDEEMIALLPPKSDLFHAAILADAEGVAGHLKEPEAAQTHDANQMAPLHYATLSGLGSEAHRRDLAHIAHLLCDAGADMNAAPQIGPYPSTPVLHFAAWGNNIAVAKVLLERDANPDLGFGNCLWRQPGELADLFLKHGADVNAIDCAKTGRRLLHTRVHWNLTSVVTWLLTHGADPNLPDHAGNTALHEAAQRGASRKIFEALHHHGARPDLKNHAGKKAEEVAHETPTNIDHAYSAGATCADR